MPRRLGAVHTFEREVRRALRLAGVDSDRSPCVIAVSGGADSTALLLAVTANVSRFGGLRTIVGCYVDQNLRDRAEVDAERAMLEQLSCSLCVPLVMRRVG